MRLLLKCIIVIALAGALGCANRYDQFGVDMDRMIGSANKATLVERYGLPEKQVTLDKSNEVWEYHLNKNNYTSGTGYRFSTYDKLTITFKDGKLSTWSVEYVIN